MLYAFDFGEDRRVSSITLGLVSPSTRAISFPSSAQSETAQRILETSLFSITLHFLGSLIILFLTVTIFVKSSAISIFLTTLVFAIFPSRGMVSEFLISLFKFWDLAMGGIFILFSVRLSISFLETFKVEKNFDDKDAERLSAVL